MTKTPEPNPLVMLVSASGWLFSAFSRRIFHPRPQEGVFRCDLNKIIGIWILVIIWLLVLGYWIFILNLVTDSTWLTTKN